MKNALMIVFIFLMAGDIPAQEKSVRDLDFLIGEWEVREDNVEKNWWEKATRVGKYVLDSTYIELESSAVPPMANKERIGGTFTTIRNRINLKWCPCLATGIKFNLTF